MLLIAFIYSSSLFLKVKIKPILAILNEITEGLKCYNLLDAVKKDPVTFEKILCYSDIFDWDNDSFTQALVPKFSDDGTNTKRLDFDGK